jgi:hypothetical protein
MLMTACSQKEATEWRSRLSQVKPIEPYEQAEPIIYNSLYLQVKSLGTVFRKPGKYDKRKNSSRLT